MDTARNEIIAVDLPDHGLSSKLCVDYTERLFTDAAAEFPDHCSVTETTVVESIGASIALGLAACGCPGVVRVIALNPYDYGRRGGIRLSSEARWPA